MPIMLLEQGIALALVSIVYLALVYLILRGTQALELKLTVLGLVTALLALWGGQLGLQQGAMVRAGPVQGGGVIVGGDGAAILGRIAFVLVLAGVAIGLVKQLDRPVVSPSREEAIRELKN